MPKKAKKAKLFGGVSVKIPQKIFKFDRLVDKIRGKAG